MKSNGDILKEAHALINGPRQGDYGTPSENFGRIASMWTAYLGFPVTCKDAAIMMALLKIARESNRHKPDNILDACGYIGLAGDFGGNHANHD